MLKSLFGDLTPTRDPREPQSDFAATAILESTSTEVNERGQMVDRHLKDLFVTGSPAQAIRAHFGNAREDAAPGTRVVALYDPARMWSSAVVKALSDASGQPIERLHLRDQATLGTLAMIERTTLPRRLDDTLKIYSADVRNESREANDIPMALLERSDLAAVIVGPMQPAAIDEMISALLVATSSGTWRCPRILFMLPVGAVWIANKIDTVPWPRSIQVATLSEPLTSASAVWNALLAHWNRIKPQLTPSPLIEPATGWGTDDFPIKVAELPGGPTTSPGHLYGSQAHVAVPGASVGARVVPATPERPALASHVRSPEPERAGAVLQELMRLDGLMFAALVDAGTGMVVASEGRGVDVERAAAAATEIVRTHRRNLRLLGHARPNDPVDEIMVTAGSRYHLMRTVQAFPDYFVLCVLDKLRSNLALARFRIMEAQQSLL